MERFLNIGDQVGTFVVKSVSKCDEVGGILYELKNTICGATLLFLHTSESNKLFSVTFKTIPTDSTGVFHILEHSVLGGSSKYPVREPFVELLKSSLNTYLNAMTFPDKTMYPVSSRNEKDFYNLTSVYLDAVFKPAIYTNPNIFYQEGWHYEVDPDTKEVSINGVVYNEMKGAESSVDERLINALNEMLYPDNCYHNNSGGDTRVIPTLTYEKFLDTHKKFYSPDNAVFYLEGDLNLKTTIGMFDEYIYHEESFNPEITAIKKQEVVPAVTREICYPVGEEEDTSKKTHYIFAKRWCSFAERSKALAVKVINSYLCAFSSSPLMKKVVMKDLATEATIAVQSSMKDFYASIEFYNASSNSKDELCQVMREVKEEILRDGFNRDDLEAIICRLEFMSREEREPKAIGHMVSVVTDYLYGGDFRSILEVGPVLKELRDGLDNGLYVKVFEELFDEENLSLVIAEPSKTLAEEEELAERNLINELTSKWSDEDYASAVSVDMNLKKWQQTPDSDEQLMTLPSLKIDDISTDPPKFINKEIDCGSVKLLLHPANLSEVTYLRFYFPIPKEYQNDLPKINFLTNLLTELPTRSFDTIALNREIKKNFGAFNVLLSTGSYGCVAEEGYCHFVLSVSIMKSNMGSLGKFIEEVLLHTSFKDSVITRSILDQIVDSFREDFISDGHLIGRQRARSSMSVTAALNEMIDGYEYYSSMKKLRENFESEFEALSVFFETFMKDVIRKDGLTIGITMSEKDFESCDVIECYKIDSVLEAIPEVEGGEVSGAGACGAVCHYKDRKYIMDLRFPYVEKTFIRIPGKVSFASEVGSAIGAGITTDGRWSVISNILKYDYLWNRVRVQGGAYGVSMGTTRDNLFALSSYRDPYGYKTFGVFDNICEAIRAYVSSEGELIKFIISTVGEGDPLVTPRAYGTYCDREFFDGYTDEMRQKNLLLKLNLSYDDLLMVADEFDTVFKAKGLVAKCLVGSDAGDFEPDQILEI